MTQISVPQPLVPSKAQNPSLPVALMPLALEEVPESASPTAPEPPPTVELGDDRYYTRHWGINE